MDGAVHMRNSSQIMEMPSYKTVFHTDVPTSTQLSSEIPEEISRISIINALRKSHATIATLQCRLLNNVLFDVSKVPKVETKKSIIFHTMKNNAKVLYTKGRLELARRRIPKLQNIKDKSNKNIQEQVKNEIWKVIPLFVQIQNTIVK